MDIITIIKYVFLGLLQGVTEPIPVSSSGHLVIARELFGIEASGLSFEIFLNTASLIAILFVYRKDIISIIQNLWRFVFHGARDNDAVTDFKYTICLIIATIPAGVAGLLLKDVIGENISVGFVGLMLLVTGLALLFIKNKRGAKRDGDLTIKDSIIVGISQCMALTPGISRSGASIVGAIAVGLSQKNALRFAFLLYIPVSVGTAMISVGDIVNDPNMNTLWLAYLLAFIVTIIATYFAVKWLQNVMERGNLIIFVYYCFALGAFSILYQFIWA
ncbi:undecaprenyl-diphosphatase 1 [Jeotgalicoccus coquinae]|uniref:Undecaprenyl-diphosphatase n=1 Tax=Jeotgalicoccus coquinae TaxID=709509 RepID=A0A6V7RLL2_9STAP|nr:undecaprenyl-diphosphate phosphatase [Jeotgalicoccus coquinae]MBB6422391.1 undecaprenyl-diphosphatase [Jeotgalicoccus coquinae]GGE16168.1 undecaprenyl-diphosphatase 1 [Jeotgalicoccus coquinae]CAD2078730.1 Undecaprenyl-diphosphatase [Jeotgalicoccus coquinae]